MKSIKPIAKRSKCFPSTIAQQICNDSVTVRKNESTPNSNLTKNTPLPNSPVPNYPLPNSLVRNSPVPNSLLPTSCPLPISNVPVTFPLPNYTFTASFPLPNSPLPNVDLLKFEDIVVRVKVEYVKIKSVPIRYTVVDKKVITHYKQSYNELEAI